MRDSRRGSSNNPRQRQVQGLTPHARHYERGSVKVIKLRWPIVIDKKPKAVVTVNCYHCAAPFFVANLNVRAVNFCSQCR
jgi:hypothetical protein